MLGCASAPKGVVTPVDGGVELLLSQNPALAEAGGQVSVTLEEGRILVVRGEGNDAIAVDQRCPHRGCSVAWKSDAKAFVCPCHGSTFEADGALREGPAKTPLRAYEAAVEGERVVVSLAQPAAASST